MAQVNAQWYLGTFLIRVTVFYSSNYSSGYHTTTCVLLQKLCLLLQTQPYLVHQRLEEDVKFLLGEKSSPVIKKALCQTLEDVAQQKTQVLCC